MNQLDPRNFKNEPDPQTWPPEEDYDNGADYSFGMSDTMRVLTIGLSAIAAVVCVALLFIAYFGA